MGLWEIGKFFKELWKMNTKLNSYRQNKPIYWPPSLSTSLAEAELEYLPCLVGIRELIVYYFKLGWYDLDEKWNNQPLQ
ncbi:uncharacterized protein OCT59_000202 [Rhizophagus irregularis]|uniref:uncharacterized protein n=1 Tax=Rhizophagus irregularis TaxID=588596 RepID=UPI00331DC6CC|nr:hypothetical protein OCT59_000202 [Rhizophagus irregularis]